MANDIINEWRVYNLHKRNLIQVQLVHASFFITYSDEFLFFFNIVFSMHRNIIISSIKIPQPFTVKWFVFQLIDITLSTQSSHLIEPHNV